MIRYPKHKSITLLFVLAFAFNIQAQIPVNYYTSCEGKKDAALKTALYQVINPHTKLSYSLLWNYYPATDSRPENTAVIWDMYSNNTTYFSNHVDMQKEHCVPKSWWDEDNLGSESVQYSDLFNLYPSWGAANQAKLNYPLSEVDGATTYNNGSCKIGNSTFSGYTDIAFEPADAYKGDFARTYLYMATCYQNISTWQSYSYCMYQNNTYPTLTTWAINLLLQWHRQDPVDAKETNRNNAAHDFQGNRNPFIDYPILAEYIWGDSIGEIWYKTASTGIDKINANTIDLKYTLCSNSIELDIEEAEDANYRIMNLYGSCIKSDKLNSNTIDISEIPNGMYILQTINKGQSKGFPFLIRK